MNWVHLHLALNHVPVWGTPFIVILLVTGIIKRSDEIKRLCLVWFLALAIVSIPIKFTGDHAYDATADAAWMNRARAEAHEQSADQATTAVFVLGVVAALGVFLGRGDRTVPGWIYVTSMILALATLCLMARTANLGGQLRHDEIRSSVGADSA